MTSFLVKINVNQKVTIQWKSGPRPQPDECLPLVKSHVHGKCQQKVENI